MTDFISRPNEQEHGKLDHDDRLAEARERVRARLAEARERVKPLLAEARERVKPLLDEARKGTEARYQVDCRDRGRG